MCSKGIIFILLLTISAGTLAQNITYKEVDSISYALYTQQQWVNLIEIGEMAIVNGIDYYYLNLRLGIACYNTQDYYKAQKYFEQALKQNQTEQTANEYLFLIKILTNKPLSADINYSVLDDTTQKLLEDYLPYFNSSIYFEGGIKISNDKDLENNEPIFRLIADQKIANRIYLGISASYIGQHNADWGFYNQYEIGLLPSLAVGINTNLLVGWRYIYNNIDSYISSSENFRKVIDTNVINGPATLITDSTITNIDEINSVSNVNALIAGVEHYYRRFTFSAQGLFYIQHINSDNKKTITTTVEKRIVRGNFVLSKEVESETIKTIGSSNFTNYYYQLMLGVSYIFPVLNNGLKVGLSTYIPLNDSFSKTVWVPALSIRLSDKLWFYGEWLQKKDIPLLYQNGNIYLNQSYELKRRITLGLKFSQSNNIHWYFTYLNEDKLYLTDETINQFNSIIIGINIKF